jgi:hypothetical protein
MRSRYVEWDPDIDVVDGDPYNINDLYIQVGWDPDMLDGIQTLVGGWEDVPRAVINIGFWVVAQILLVYNGRASCHGDRSRRYGRRPGIDGDV